MSGAPADLPAGRAACCSRSRHCWRSCSRPWPSGASRSAASPAAAGVRALRERRRGADRVLGHLGRGRLDRAHGAAQLRAVPGRAGRDRQWHAVRPALGHADHLDRCYAGRLSRLRPRALAGPAVRATMVAPRHQGAIDRWALRQGGGALLFSRFVPVISFNLINYAAGLTAISWWTFTWATGLGILPLTFLMVLMGDRLWSGEAGPWLWLLARRWPAGCCGGRSPDAARPSRDVVPTEGRCRRRRRS